MVPVPSPDPAPTPGPASSNPSPEIEVEVFHDGRCSICAREIRVIRWLDRRDRIRFTDIAEEDFTPPPGAPSLDGLMRRIRARTPDGAWIEGPEVFRRIYAAVGFRWLVPLTRLPGVRPLIAALYRRFARWRYRRRCRSGYCPLPEDTAGGAGPDRPGPAPTDPRP